MSESENDFANAVRSGSAETVARLLDSHADPSSVLGLHAPPLWVASECGHDAVVSILALKKADVECVGPYGRTALMVAAASGHCNVLESLLAAKAEPSREAFGGQTPLLELCCVQWPEDSAGSSSGHETATATTTAAACGQTAALEVLVSHGALVNQENSSGCTPLIAAARGGQVNAIKQLTKLGANPNASTQAGMTPLAAATLGGSQLAISALISAKADPNDSCRRGRGTALCVAAARGSAGLVRHLISHRASPDAISADCETALTTAAACGQQECVRALCELGASPDLETAKGVTAAIAAVLNGQPAALESLLECGASPDYLTASGNSALMAACTVGSVAGCRTLAAGKANLDLLSAARAVTPLVCAISNGKQQVVQALLELKAMPNKCAGGQVSPMCVACRHGQIGSLKALAAVHPAGLATEANNGSCPLLQAVEAAQAPIIEALVGEFKLDPNCESRQGSTPLISAAVSGNCDVIKLLVSLKANPEHETRSGRSALLAAATCNQPEVIKTLIELRADVNAVSQMRGFSPVQQAVCNRKLAAVEMLLDCRASVQTGQVSWERPPLHTAAAFGDSALVDLLLSCSADPSEVFDGISPLMAGLAAPETDASDAVLLALLQHGATDTSRALIHAAHEGNLRGVQQLMRSDVTAQGKRDAAVAASENGQLRVMEVLLPVVSDEDVVIALMAAVTSESTSTMQLIIEEMKKRGINLDSETADGDTALMVASAKGATKAVSLLLASGVTIDLETTHGNTALIAAAFDGQCRVVQVLLDHHANSNLVTSIGMSALSAASLCRLEGHGQCIQLLWAAQANSTVHPTLPPLAAACEAGNIDAAKQLIDLGADAAEIVSGLTPLMRVCKAAENQHAIAQLLIEARAAADTANEEGNTALHMACLGGHIALAQLLIEHKADPSCAAANKSTPMTWAAAQGQAETVQLLLQAGAMHEPAALIAACEACDMDCLGAMLELGFDPYQKADDNRSPIEYSILCGDPTTTAFLAAQDTELEAAQQHQLLLAAVKSGSAEMVAVLLETGCSPRSPLSESASTVPTPLEQACMQGEMKMVDLLLQSGAHAGITALCLVGAAGGTHELLQLLLAQEPDLNQQVLAGSLCSGQTALIAAVIAGSGIAVRSLLAAGAMVDLEAIASGHTALIAAAEAGSEQIVEQLVDAQADVNLETCAGGTALLHAVVAGQQHLIGLLVELGARVNHQHRGGSVALVEAAALGDVTAVAALIAAGADTTQVGMSARVGFSTAVEVQASPLTALEAAARTGQTAVTQELNSFSKLTDVCGR